MARDEHLPPWAFNSFSGYQSPPTAHSYQVNYHGFYPYGGMCGPQPTVASPSLPLNWYPAVPFYPYPYPYLAPFYAPLGDQRVKKQDNKNKKEEKTKKAVTFKLSGKNPPSMLPGQQLLFTKDHTSIHLIDKNEKPPWETPGKTFGFEMFKVGCNMTINEVIEILGGDEKSSITECWEDGDGQWVKGQTIKQGSDNAKKNVALVGWNKMRGEEMQPVWLVLTREK